MEVIELSHPLVLHKLSILRNEKTGTKEFRELISELATFLCYEAMKDAELDEVVVKTPMCKTKGKMLNEDKYAFVPILRAGTGMLEGLIRVMPNAKIGHIGLYRNEETLKPVKYYYKMPKGIENREIRSDIEILPTIFSFWGMLSGTILLAANKEEYITQHLKKSKSEFLLYGFDMLYNSLIIEGRK